MLGVVWRFPAFVFQRAGSSRGMGMGSARTTGGVREYRKGAGTKDGLSSPLHGGRLFAGMGMGPRIREDNGRGVASSSASLAEANRKFVARIECAGGFALLTMLLSIKGSDPIYNVC